MAITSNEHPTFHALGTTEQFLGAASEARHNNHDIFFAPGLKDPNWEVSSMSTIGLNWDKSFPYQLLILDKEEDSYKILRRHTLPIPPQGLSISTPFAINTSITMGGVLEEHNAAPIRMITLQGTTGLLPLRGAVPKPGFAVSQLSSIFAGTASGIRQIAGAVTNTRQAISGTSPQRANIIFDTDLSSASATYDENSIEGTGYYQFHLLKRFLEGYAYNKKNAWGGASTWRLGFAIWKDQEIYLVSPVSFDLNRNAASPMEYPYTLQLKGWKRLSTQALLNASKPYNAQPGPRSDPNVLSQVLTGIIGGRQVLEGARATLAGIRADIQQVLFTPVREAMLFIKDLQGVAMDMNDFPANILTDFKESILELPNLQRLTVSNASANVQRAWQDLLSLANDSGKSDTSAGRDPRNKQAVGLGSNSSQNRYNAHPAHTPFEYPDDNFEFFKSIPVKPGDLNLRPDTKRKMDAERARVARYQRQDFEAAKEQILRVLGDFSDFVGAGDSTYTQVYGLPVRTSTRTPTDDEWDVIFALNDIVQQFDVLCSTTDINRNQVSSMDYVAGLATRSGIAFTVPRSKFAVNFPYGSTLEQLSALYLKDPARWHEIATLNGLQAPYVDEIGFKLPLLTNGIDNQVVVSDNSNLYVGQKVWLSSGNVLREWRRIQKITPIGTAYVVVLDGNADLAKFSTLEKAVLQAFIPNTVNSQMQIFIPSDSDPSENDYKVKDIPGVDYFDPLVRAGGVDFLLTYGNDLVITPDGDGRLAVGLNNLIQRARLAIGTYQGSLMNHPDYGIGLKPGMSVADSSANSLLNDLRQMFKDDAGYAGVQSVSVLKSGNAAYVNMSIGIEGTGQFIPISVEVKT